MDVTTGLTGQAFALSSPALSLFGGSSAANLPFETPIASPFDPGYPSSSSGCTSCGDTSFLDSLFAKEKALLLAGTSLASKAVSALPDITGIKIGDDVSGNQEKGVSNVALIALAIAAFYFLGRK